MLFAEIILPLSLPRTLTYGVPESLHQDITEGIRVEVAFGKNKAYSGIVFQLHHQKPDSYQVKPIKKILDQKPIVSALQLTFWEWIASYYCCTLGDVMQAALPAHLKLMNNSVLVWNDNVMDIPNDLSDEGYLLAEALQIRKKLTIEEAKLIAEEKNHAHAIAEIIEWELAFIEDELKEKYRPKKEKFVGLNSIYVRDETALEPVFESLKKAPRQSELLLQFFQIRQQEKEVLYARLLKKSRASAATLNALVNKGILEIYTKDTSRILLGKSSERVPSFELNEEQESARISLLEQWKEKPVVLLQGVTGSGKTMVYIRLIEEQIQAGKQVLFLLPEIALTTQIVHRLHAYFGDKLGVYHSRFSNNERVEIWQKVQKAEYQIILGARSSLWLPFQQLSLIIVDEEHETSYKQQDPAPRFQARDAAIYLAGLSGAKVLLGSATPSLESAYNVQTGKYGYASLKSRFQNLPLPYVTTVAAGNTKPSLSSLLTLPLLNALQETLSDGRQVLLFQNKRGYAPFLICALCGHIPHCPNCDVSLTYHKASDKLHCHYCGQRSQPLKHCPQCGSNKIMARSFGTEKIEEELQRIFPKRKTARMDTDSVRGKNRMNQIIRDFELGRIDILVGTQMIVKGLDFENVGLVGILSADSIWSFPDFRVNERSFQLMEQVSGRAGRTINNPGRVFIQAYNQKHPLLEWIRKHDYRSFFREEMNVRQQFNYPPFSKLIQLTLRHQNQTKVATASQVLAIKLQQSTGITVQGPVPAIVARVRNHYLFEIRLKIPRNIAIKQEKQKILQAIRETQSQRGNSGIIITIDVDPG